MKNLLHNPYFNISIYPIFFILGYYISSLMGYTMYDDGWRHLAMAFYQDEIGSWGELFIHSLYKDYDPWFIWHNLIRFLASITSNESVHIIINGFIYASLSSWFYIVFKRYSQFNLYMILFLSIVLPILNYRYFFLRPDVISGLFLLYFMLIQKRYLIILISLLYIPFYYVFWFYFGYLGILKLFLKKYKDLILLICLCIIGFIFHLSYNMDGFIDITKNVLNNDVLLQGNSVGESKPMFLPLEIKNSLGSTFLLITLLAISYLFYIVFKPKDRVLELLILFMPLIILQVRFYALLYPLILAYGSILIYKFSTIIYENGLTYAINLVINFIKERSYFGDIPKKYIKLLFVITVCGILSFSFIEKIISYKKYQKDIKNLDFILADEFKNKRILFSSMNTSLYISIYKNPTAKYLPSCSLGWVDYKDEDLKNTYFKLLTNKKTIEIDEFSKFLEFNKIDIIIVTYDSNNIVINSKELNEKGYEFYKLYKNNIIFIKK